MAETLQCLSGTEQLEQSTQLEQLNIFGVRHLSPASAHHLLEHLNKIRPKCVLIEGPSDCNDFLKDIADKRVKPPVALLIYTTQSPVRTILYPFAEYSPEYQAIRWAYEHRAEVSFIDLPASATISADFRHSEKNINEEQEKKDKTAKSYREAQSEFYINMAELTGEHDYETAWERHFEHCQKTDDFIEKISAYSESMRNSLEDLQWQTEQKEAAYNYVRETYMKKKIAEAEKRFRAEEIVVITGAYHVSGLSGKNLPPMTDDEYKMLPSENVKMTLMPYSYYRLSSKSGYGAGNKAPAYFQLMWECIQADDLERLPAVYLSSIAGITRESGNYNSTASAIEAVRLAKSLAYMKNAVYPTLKDLHDSAVCLLGGGELSAVAEAAARIDIGTAIGELPEGVSQTPVQDDMNRQLKILKLEKYKSIVAQDISLDLREKRTVKSTDAAYIDLNRSIFFNRLKLLEIGFAQFQGAGASAWSENWILRWSPEHEIELVEATLKGETIENAAAFVLKEKFDASANILEIAKLMGKAFICNLFSELPNGLMRLQELCVEGENFAEAAYTALEISNIIKYRDIRNVDTQPLIPILQQTFLRAALIMFNGASCNEEAAADFIQAIDAMHTVSQEQFEYINDELWLKKLREIADSDNRNAKISGAATAILMERNAISDEDLKSEVTRRLSYGVPGDLAAMWFEGLSARNRYVLLSRINIWKQLDSYLDTLDETEFKRTLVFLRRAFSSFSPQEKNSAVDILSDLWEIDSGGIAEFLQEELSEAEQDKLDELNDFDFDFDL